MRIVVAVTGASGVVIARNLLKNLKEHEIHLIISKNAKKVINAELPPKERNLKKFADFFYDSEDLNSKLASSSFILDAMIVVPCSLKTLASIANGLSDNLISRCAENILKFNKKLILVVRDTPLSLAAIENMRKAKVAGAIILPANIAYYYKPKNVEDVTNFFVGKILDALSIDHKLYRRWGE